MGAKEEYEAKKRRDRAKREADAKTALDKQTVEARLAAEREEIAARKIAEGEEADRIRAVTESDAKRWWFRQKNPIDRFTGWLVAWTALLFVVTIANAIILSHTDDKIGEQAKIAAEQRKVMQDQLAEMKATGAQTDTLIETNKKLAEAA